MSLFPDRQLATTSSRELALVSPVLTEQQKRQLGTVTEGYMREHKRIGYENTKAVLPVIKQCITDGLQARYKRENILPDDNLSQAFREGYEQRKNLIGIMETELEGLSGKMRLEGALALPQDLVSSASRELRDRIFLPKLVAGQGVAEITRVRRPILKQFVNYSRDRIEQDIPGSKKVVLTAQQEAGLVRNLVFGWAAFREPRLLLETEDFMTYRQVYLTEIAQQGDTLWEELARLAGQDSPQAMAYLKDMSAQVADLLALVPDKPSSDTDALAVASSIDTAFKALESHFLVVNPFNKLPSFSEDPKDKGRSIWDENRSTNVVINGVIHSVPTVQTLSLAAYLISGENPDRAFKYRVGADYVSGLIAEVTRQSLDNTKPYLEQEIKEGEEAFQTLQETIAQRAVPQEGVMARSTVSRLVNSQNALMRDEMQFISVVRDNCDRLITSALDLLRRYQYGDTLKSDSDFRRILTLVYSPGVLRRSALYFVRERIVKRIRSFEDILAYENFADAMASEAFVDYAKSKFPASLSVTVLDVLSFRNNFWLDQYLKPRPDLSPGQLVVAWIGILDQEKRGIESEAWNRASHRVAEMTRKRIEAEKDRILANPVNSLGRRYARVLYLQAALGTGELPDEESLYQTYLDRWRKTGDQKIASAMREWTDKDSLVSSLDRDLVKIDGIEVRRPERIQFLLDKARRTNGPLRIVLEALTRIGPSQLLPDYPVSMVDLAHNVRPEDPNDPFSYTRRGLSGEKLDPRLFTLYKSFQNWLTANGIHLSEDVFEDVIKPKAMIELIMGGNAYHRLFGIEKELQKWYSNQSARLTAQVGDHSSRFYNTPPDVLISECESSIAFKKKRLESLKRRDARSLDSRVNNLQQLGLIRAEEPHRS